MTQRIDIPAGVDPKNWLTSFSSKYFHLILLPTEQCNFRCTYCYEKFDKGRMSDQLQVSIERLMERRSLDISSLSISWFGGEPLVATDIVLRISRYANHLSQLRGFSFNGSITTNGYNLTKDLIGELCTLRLKSFQVSLDGYAMGHDISRKKSNGSGTFDRIWHNVLSARDVDADFSMMLRLHLTQDNEETLELLCSEIASNFGGDKRFIINFQDIRFLGGSPSALIKDIPKNDMSRRVARLKDILLTRGAFSQEQITSNLDASGESAASAMAQVAGFSGSYICYASRPNTLLIRSDGTIGKCTVYLDNDKNRVGKLLPDGSVEIDQDKNRFWSRGFFTKNLSELACPAASLDFW